MMVLTAYKLEKKAHSCLTLSSLCLTSLVIDISKKFLEIMLKTARYFGYLYVCSKGM